jgi:aminoglycoside phosphotransferase family enzyme
MTPPFVLELRQPGAYPHPCAAIELFETHISWVLLTGEFAYKIKSRSVRLPRLRHSRGAATAAPKKFD